MSESSSTHGWIDLLLADGPFLSAGALDASTVGERWPTRLDAAQRLLLRGPRADVVVGDVVIELDGDDLRHRVESILTELLGYRSKRTLDLAPNVEATHHIYRAKVRADFVVHAVDDPGDVRMVVMCDPQAVAAGSHRTTNFDGWISTPVQRAALLARHAGANLALLSDGYQHLLVNVVTGTTGSATWTRSGLEDKTAQDAFVALLHKERVLHRQTPTSKLIELSQDRQQELTKTLGRQVRRAAEVLVNAISRANRTTRGELLADVDGPEVYAAVTRVLMRTVFLLLAEERGLLPVAENQLYADEYAVSTLLDRLEQDEYRNRSAMQRRSGAWQRLLALSRALFEGVDHDRLRLAAYGGDLFDPDTHAFLEGRIAAGATGAGGHRHHSLDVGVVDDYTVLTVLRHLQIAEGQRISFRSLDVEQVGHVYESLLDHSAVVVLPEDIAVLGLVGRGGDEPEISVAKLEAWSADGEDQLEVELASLGVADDAAGVRDLLAKTVDSDSDVARTISIAVGNDDAVRERVSKYLPILRTDARGVALVFMPEDVYVTETSSRRDSGTAYTPRSLADEVAKYTLDPLIYEPGPHNQPDDTKWKLRPPGELLELKICDPAVGSAAILVAAARYLAEAVLQSRIEFGDLRDDALETAAGDEEMLDVRVDARRDVVSTCMYGVDRDGLAVETAKLSLWLFTMARDRPFTFLDHAIRCGNSLFGIRSVEQLRSLHPFPEKVAASGKGSPMQLGASEWIERIGSQLNESERLRRRLQAVEERSAEDVQMKAELRDEAARSTETLIAVADRLTQLALAHSGEPRSLEAGLLQLAADISGSDEWSHAATSEPTVHVGDSSMHWPLEYPEVFQRERPGFDALVGNPPFIGAKLLPKNVGTLGVTFLREAYSATGMVNLAAFFLRRFFDLTRDGGTFGLIMTDQARIGASRDHGSDALIDLDAKLFRASPMRPWPAADAPPDVCLSWWSKFLWETRSTLVSAGGTETQVARIDGGFRAAPKFDGHPSPLVENRQFFSGIGNQHGDALIMTVVPDELAESPFLRRFISGDDLAKHAFLKRHRFAIACEDLSLEEVRSEHPATADWLQTNVGRGRGQGLPKKYKRLERDWWQMFEHRAPLYRALREAADEVIVLPVVSKWILPAVAPSSWCFTNKMAIVAGAPDNALGFLGSAVGAVWIERNSGRMRTHINISIDKALKSIPWGVLDGIDASPAANLSSLMFEWCEDRGRGATDFFNLIHDKDSDEGTAASARALYQQSTQAVTSALGLGEESLGWREWEDGTTRYLLSEPMEIAVLDVLREANLRSWATEVGKDPDAVVAGAAGE